MSSTASNYDVPRLVLGQGISAVSFSLAIVAAYPTLSSSAKSCAPILVVTLLYGIMMFASSYVEEEQHFWYWATTAWLGLLWIKW
jgi:ethanolaminephosphotransferase